MLARFPANRIQKLRGVSCFANDQDEVAFELVGWEFRLQVFEKDQRRVLAWYQAEDREFEKMDLVFQAMTTSLLQSM